MLVMSSNAKNVVNGDYFTHVANLMVRIFLNLRNYSKTCVTPSFNDMDSEIGVNVYVRADLNCASTIEIPYYSAKYEDICINCGSIDNLKLSEHLEQDVNSPERNK